MFEVIDDLSFRFIPSGSIIELSEIPKRGGKGVLFDFEVSLSSLCVKAWEPWFCKLSFFISWMLSIKFDLLDGAS